MLLKNIKCIALVVWALSNIACVGVQPTLSLSAYDSLGYKINHKNYLVDNDDVPLVSSSLCKTYPCATIYVINSGQKLQGSYQCSGTTFIKNFIPPYKLTYEGKTYKMLFTRSTGNFSIYEYTNNQQTLDNWSSLISFSHTKPAKSWRPLDFVKSMQTSASEHNAFLRYEYTKNNGFLVLILSPSVTKKYYELRVQKSFHLTECNGLVIKSFSYKYEVTTNLRKDVFIDKILQKGVKIVNKLKNNLWVPNCQVQ